MLVIATTSCIYDADLCLDDSENQNINITAYLNLTIQLPIEKSRSEFYPDADGEQSGSIITDYRGNHINENKLTCLWVYFVNVNNNVEDWANAKWIPVLELKGETQVKLKVNIRSSIVHLYVVANLDNSSFIQMHEPVTLDKKYNYHQLLYNNFVSPQQGITMVNTDPVVVKASEITHSSEYDPFVVEVPVTRLLAKVLLTSKGMVGNENYMQLIPPVGLTETPGWIKTNSMKFKLENINRKVNLLYQKEGNNEVDANYAIATILKEESGNIGFISEEKREEYFSAPDVNVFTIGANANCYPVLKYDEARMNPAGSNPYNEGLYCLPNTFDNNWTTFNGLCTDGGVNEWSNAAKLLATYLVVECRYIPGAIYDEAGNEHIFVNENSAETWIKGQSTDQKATYFYSYQEEKFYTKQATDNSRIKYTDGKCYFFTHIDGGTHINPTNPEKSWVEGIQRDWYYILTCKSIRVPLSPEPLRMTIVDWQTDHSAALLGDDFFEYTTWVKHNTTLENFGK